MNTITLSSAGQHWTVDPGFADVSKELQQKWRLEHVLRLCFKIFKQECESSQKITTNFLRAPPFIRVLAKHVCIVRFVHIIQCFICILSFALVWLVFRTKKMSDKGNGSGPIVATPDAESLTRLSSIISQNPIKLKGHEYKDKGRRSRAYVSEICEMWDNGSSDRSKVVHEVVIWDHPRIIEIAGPC